MQRRKFLSAVGASLAATGAISTVSASSEDDIATSFFDALREADEQERGQLVVACADDLCVEGQMSDASTEQIIEDVDRINQHVRRIRFGVQILNENNITTAIDSSMVHNFETGTRDATRFVPLIGSFNNLQAAACEVDSDPNPADVERFLYACVAFGLEVWLWHSTAPFQMAWHGTRFASNRTLLRYANHGCNGCIAWAMSEIHWALRSVPYTAVSEDRIEFVAGELDQLREVAREEDYDVDLDLSREEIQAVIEDPVGGGGGGGAVAVAPTSNQEGRLSDLLVIVAAFLGCYWISRDR